MIHTIKSNNITVGISEIGGELMSIKSADGTEYLWQGDPQYWAGRAYNLFPVVGRLWKGVYTYKGKEYEMGIHGFVRKKVLNVTAQTDSSITFSYSSNEETLKIYPFNFEYGITYFLNGNTLSVSYNVKNSGDDLLRFAVGAHPGFNVPLGGESSFEDWYLEFGCEKPAKQLQLTATCFMTDEYNDFTLEKGKILLLKHSLFDNDAIVLKNMCRNVTLKSDKSEKSVTVDFPDLKYLGIWHKPDSDAPYVCIEPWSSVPSYDGVIDNLETKRDMIVLNPLQEYKNTHTITIK